MGESARFEEVPSSARTGSANPRARARGPRGRGRCPRPSARDRRPPTPRDAAARAAARRREDVVCAPVRGPCCRATLEPVRAPKLDRARDAAPRRRAVPSGMSDRSESGSAGLEPVRFSSRRDKYLAKSARASSRASPHPRAPSASRADVRRTLASSSWCSLWRPSRASRARRSLVVARTRARSSPVPLFAFRPNVPRVASRARRVPLARVHRHGRRRARRRPRRRPLRHHPQGWVPTGARATRSAPPRDPAEPKPSPPDEPSSASSDPSSSVPNPSPPVPPPDDPPTLSALVPAGWHLPHLRR